MFAIRSADPAEAAAVSELVLLSDCGMLPALFGPRVRLLLQWLLPRRGNPYSTACTLVITDRDPGAPAGQVIGAAVGALASTTRGDTLRTAAQLARWYGPAFISRLPRLMRAGAAVDALARDDFYLSHIAVLRSRQGRGAGAALLRAVEERARAAGARQVVLDVEDGNTGARAFYARMGYEEASAVRIDLGRHGAFAFRRLFRAP